MTTVAYVFILTGLLIFRQVYKGRVMNIGEDLSDAFIAFTTGNTSQLTAILARTGDGNKVTPVEATGSPDTSTTLGVAAAAIKRGKAAKGYRWTATGPDYYDCSGLMWRACQDNGFTGVRFTTSTIQLSKQFREVSDFKTNDIVVWPTHHMGVLTTPGKFYSARNPQSGIGETNVEGFRDGPRKYYRLTL